MTATVAVQLVMATLRFRLGALLLGAAMTFGTAACTNSDGQSTSAPAAPSSPSTSASSSDSSVASPSPSAGGPGPVGSSTTPAAPPAGHPTKGPIEPDNPVDPRPTLTLTGTIHTTGSCVYLDTPSGRWYLGAAPQTLHDGAAVTVRGRRIATPTKCTANQALLVQQVN